MGPARVPLLFPTSQPIAGGHQIPPCSLLFSSCSSYKREKRGPALASLRSLSAQPLQPLEGPPRGQGRCLSTSSCGLWLFRTWSKGQSFLWSTFRLSTSWRICSLNLLRRLHSLVSCLCSLGTLISITPGPLPDRLLAVGASYGPEASCPSAPAFFRFLLSAFQSLSSTSFGTVGGCSPVDLPVVSYV